MKITHTSNYGHKVETKLDFWAAGFLLTMGAVTAIAVLIVMQQASAWAKHKLAGTPAPAAHDDTDPPGGRSGMQLYTDHRTGVQYLRVGDALTPRLNADGTIVSK